MIFKLYANLAYNLFLEIMFSVMKMFHYSFDPNLKLKEVIQSYTRNYSKPDGLYFAPGNTWKDWCENNTYPIGEYKYELKNYNELNILIIDETMLNQMFTSITIPPIHWDEYINEGYDGIRITKEMICKYKIIDIDYSNYPNYTRQNFIENFDVETIVIWNTEKLRIEKID